MKKFLLSLTLSVTAFLGYSQVVLNEIYVDPALAGNKNHDEFFELYNTSILPTPINLDCYTLVSYKWAKNGSKTLFVIDLPNQTINPKSYYVGAADNPLNVQGKTNQPLNFNWSDPNLTTIGGSIKKYVLNGDGATYTVSNPSSAEMQDIFFTNGQGATGYGVFLFNNGVYVNGFIGKYALATPPTEITTLPTISGLINPCGTYSLNFSTITKNEFVNQESGADNGYIRKGDGLCGTWDKAANNHTPGTENPGSTTATAGSTLTTSQKLICGNRIDFTVSAPSTGVAYPVEVQLYIDKDLDGRLDATDEFVSTYPTPIAGGSSTVYSFSSLAVIPSTWQYLVVYKTALGCFDKLAIPTLAEGAITTKELNICGNQVDFSVLTATGDAATYGLAMTVQLYEDNGTPALYEPGVDIAIGSPVNVANASTQLYSIAIPEENKGKTYILVYTSPNVCYSKTVVPQNAQGSISTTQLNVCGNQVDFSITGLTGDAINAYVFPITVNLYYDEDGDLVLDEEEMTVVATRQVTASELNQLLTIVNPDPSKKVLIQYNAAQPCFTPFPPAAPRNAQGGVVTTQKSICGSRIDYTVTAPTGDAKASYVFPMTVELHYDINGDGFLDAEDMPIISTQEVTSFSAAIRTITNPTPANKVILVYKSAQPCFTTNGVVSPAVGALTITQTENFCGKRVNYTVTGATGDAAGYVLPITLNVYHDADGNGQLSAEERSLLLATTSIGSFSATSRNLELNAVDYGKALIVEYAAAATCFSDVVKPTIATTGAVNVGGLIECVTGDCAQQRVNYFVVNESTDLNVYPLQLQVILDDNKNGEIDATEVTVIGTQNLNAPPTPGTIFYTENLADPKSWVNIRAVATAGCSQTILAVENQNTILPVRLISFSATRSNSNQVVLEWETAMEENNKGFHVQRNIDGTWKNIGFVFTKANGGNSTASLQYSFKDANNSKGISQYRILQVDIDGRGKYSEVRSVRGDGTASRLTVFPNPSESGTFNILFEDATSLRDVILSDISGRTIKQYKGVSNSSLVIDNLGAGFYTVQVINRTTGAIATEKVIIKKR